MIKIIIFAFIIYLLVYMQVNKLKFPIQTQKGRSIHQKTQ